MRSPAETAAAAVALVPAAFVGAAVFLIGSEALERHRRTRHRTTRRRPKEPRRTKGRRRDGAA